MRVIKTLLSVLLLAGLVGCNLVWKSPATPTTNPQRALATLIEATSSAENETEAPSLTQTVEETLTGEALASVEPPEGEETPVPEVPTVPIATPTLPGVAVDLPPFDAGMELNVMSTRDLEVALQAGAHWVRVNALNWADIEPTEGARNWAAANALEQQLRTAAMWGAKTILVVRTTPAWAQAVPGMRCGAVKVDKLAAFAQFVYEAVLRYSAPPYQVEYWELGNEPDVDPALVPSDNPFGCWGVASDPQYGGSIYAEMLKQVAPRIRAANPNVKILVGGLLLDCDPLNPPTGKNCTPSRYLEGILRNGGGEFFDGVSFHAYDYYAGPDRYGNSNWNSTSDTLGPVVSAKARFLHAVLTSYGVPDKFLINTEAGLLCGRTGAEAMCQGADFHRTKAAYVALTNAAALAEGLSGSVWYSLKGWRGTALVGPRHEPYPAYEAFRQSAMRLSGAVFSRQITEYPSVLGYEFTREGQKVWLLVTLDGQSRVIQLPSVPVSIYDALGNALPPLVELTIGAMPVYVEWAP
ncbi:MAG: hypothetical protein QME21_19230 [Anaerolineales bacterium]|nr:hypothetical protein [Anaerolineales bacterium]